MEHLKNVKTILNSYLSRMYEWSGIMVFAGFALLMGAAGTLDYNATVGVHKDPAGLIVTLAIGLFMTCTGFISIRVSEDGKREDF